MAAVMHNDRHLKVICRMHEAGELLGSARITAPGSWDAIFIYSLQNVNFSPNWS
jgi:hypothetical protein